MKNPSWGIREDFKEVVFVLTSEGKKEETGFPQVSVDIQEETLEAEKMALVTLSPVSGDQQIPPPEKHFHIQQQDPWKCIDRGPCGTTSRNLCWENNQRSEQRFMNTDVYSSIFIVKNCKHSKWSPMGFS